MKKKLLSLALAAVVVLFIGIPAANAAEAKLIGMGLYQPSEPWETSGEPETGLVLFSREEIRDSGNSGLIDKRVYYGLKDKSGTVVIPAEYTVLQYAAGDRIIACREVGDRWLYGIITTNGTIIYPFTDGLRIFVVNKENPVFCIFQKNDLCGLYDRNGKELLGAKCTSLWFVEGGYYIFTLGNGLSGIYKQGVGEVLPPKYERLTYAENGYFTMGNLMMFPQARTMRKR